MTFVRFIQYLGIALLMGCSVGLVFTIVFIFLLPMPMMEALLALAFFGLLGAVSILMVSTFTPSKKKQTGVPY